MRQPHPMSRLLQGDVGAGKTFVAMCAMLLAVESGAQRGVDGADTNTRRTALPDVLSMAAALGD